MKKRKIEIPFGGEAREDLAKYAKSNKALTLVLSAQLIITGFALTFAFLTWKDRVEVKISLPNGAVTMTPQSASQSFYELWGRYIIQRASNFAPTNAQDIAAELNKRLDPEAYATLADEVKTFTQGVYYGGFTQTFVAPTYKTTVDASGRRATVTATGRATRKSVFGQLIFDKPCEYSVALNYREGEPYVTSFFTTCK